MTTRRSRSSKALKDEPSHFVTRESEGKLHNYYEDVDPDDMPVARNPQAHRHGITHPLMAVVGGGTGLGSNCKSGGKTNLVLNLIHEMGDCWDHIWVFCRYPDEPLYSLLSKRMGDMVTVTDDLDALPDPKDLKKRWQDKNEQFLMIFDDLMHLPKCVQNKVIDYYQAARKAGCSCIYIAQSMFMVPRMIRLNLTMVTIKNVESPSELNRILSSYLGSELPKDLSREMTKTCQRDGSCLTILLKESDPDKKFRDGFIDTIPISHILQEMEDEEEAFQKDRRMGRTPYPIERHPHARVSRYS